MNVEKVKAYMQKANKEKFEDTLNFKNIEFLPSSDDGIIVDLESGKHTLKIGAKVNIHQMNRALILMLIDTVMEVQNEDDREKFGSNSYTEYGGKVSQLQSQYFPSEDVFIEKEGKIVKDSVIDCDRSMCRLRTHGEVNRESILGLKYSEVQLRK